MRKLDPALIGFDIDGVVADTGGAFVRIAREEYGIRSISIDDITSFEVEECIDVDPVIIETIFSRLLNDPLKAGLQPMENAMPVLHRFAAEAPLTFVTARPAVFSRIRLVAMGVHDNKFPYIKELGLSHFVDDRLQTCKALYRKGITSLVFRQPWNNNGHDLPTVDDWQAIHGLCFD
jgi:uncharacterized HAD superfamily protein